MKEKSKEMEKGITLIALVVTIVVLLILAGISINAVLGNNGLITRAKDAKDATKYASVRDEYDLYKASKDMDKLIGTSTTETFEQFITKLESNGTITSEDKTQIETEGKLTIGNYEIIFEQEITLGEVYTDDMIGQKITYSSNGQEDWIVFGKDASGNILITTELPIDNSYELVGSASNWLTYENDLHTACSGYGATVQGVNVTSRSITMEDINYVAGFTEPTFTEYTFGTTQDYDNNKVNYYYPSATGTDGWKQPTTENETTFTANWYGYYNSWDSGEYLYWGEDTDGSNIDATSLINTERCKYIWGGNTEETCYNEYLVASRSVGVYSVYADFYVAYVGSSEVYSSNYRLCSSDASEGYDRGDVGTCGVRPIVVLPSSLVVEENAAGLYDLAE